MNQIKMHSKSLPTLILMQAGVMLLLALALGALSNGIRQERIPLNKDWKPETRLAEGPEAIKEISLEEARKALASGRAVFLDARFSEAYREGHIRGAYNLPWESVEQRADEVLADIPLDAAVVTYCDGEQCELSVNLAKELFFRGYENVRVLFNGWTRWKNAGLATSKGETP